MKTPVKIRYERQPRKGAASFIGMVYFDDGSKIPIGDVDLSAMPDLPIEHDSLPTPPEPQSEPVVSFPKPKAPARLVAVPTPPRGPNVVWPFKP